MVSPYVAVFSAAVATVVVALLVVPGLRSRKKLIECPECGHQFQRPVLSQKRSGVGFTIGALGNYTCPKCSYTGATSGFKVVPSGELGEPGTGSSK